MGCAGCTVTENGSPKGCQNNGSCSTGGCNRLNTYDWLSVQGIQDAQPFQFVEVSFKNGAHKEFYSVKRPGIALTGDQVAVESKLGYDLGRITLSGELVRLQMKKKKVRPDSVKHSVLRVANQRDLERLEKVRAQEQEALVKARAIARTLDMDMKIGDVEFQGDGRKATFYYTAETRVDFRELIQHYARAFRVRIEMRQIGARQESSRIGGLGSCGRELCCSTWLTNFKSVSTAAARYQNLAINQAKLSGQCGRLKCCLNYELDTYMEAMSKFPDKADKLRTEAGTAQLIKVDIFKELMYYALSATKGTRGKTYAMRISDVEAILEMNRNGKKPTDLIGYQVIEDTGEEEVSFGDIHEVIELPPMEKRKRKKRRSKRSKGHNKSNKSSHKNHATNSSSGKSSGGDKPVADNKEGSNKSSGRNRRRGRRRRGRSKNSTNTNQNNNNKAT